MMTEELPDSLRMIRESAAGLAPRGGDRKRIRALRFTAPGYDRQVLRQMGAQGWIGILVPEAQGGIGLGMAAFCAIAEELGAALAPEPIIPAAIAANVLAAGGAEELLGAVLAGEHYLPIAWINPADRGGPRRFIPYAGGAHGFLLPSAGGDTISLHLQPASGAAVALQDTQDGGQFGTLTLGNAEPLARDCGAALTAAWDEAALATAAYLLGLMDQAFSMTLDYLKTRRQFGQFISSFQALQHRAADLKLQIELSRASIAAAVAVLDDPGAALPTRQAAVSAAKARAASAAMLVTRQAIQLHGAIGYTDEADIGLYLRKAMVLANQYGTVAFHRQRYAACAPEDF